MPPSIISCGGINVRSRPINECHWISQLTPNVVIIEPSRITKPSVRRSIYTERNEKAGKGALLNVSNPAIVLAIGISSLERNAIKGKSTGIRQIHAIETQNI
jgi:hypothetical protein